MGDLINNDMNLVAPYEQSFSNGETEQALQNVFIAVFNELFADTIKDIHHYGMPHLGSPSVVERFTKQDGLAVLRRAGSSDAIMRVIYANWKSLGSKRGLAFLEFVLRMIWGNNWQIHRLYHSVGRSASYPSLITTGETRDSFLTSRIFITLGQDINVNEALEISPVVAKLVPANIVAKIASGMDLGEITPLSLAVAAMPYMVANFQKFEPMNSLAVNWTGWNVLKTNKLQNDTVIYTGYKTNLQEYYQATATHNLRAAALTAMSDAAYNALPAINDAILALHPTSVGSEPEAPNKVVLASFVPTLKDEITAAQVLTNRVKLSGGANYMGSDYMPAILSYLGWFLQNGVLNYNVQASPDERVPFVYKVANLSNLVGFTEAAKAHIADLVAKDPAWASYTLQSLTPGDESDDTLRSFIQAYTALETQTGPHIRAPNAPFGEWVPKQEVVVKNWQVSYSGVKTNGTDYYDSTVSLDLTEAATNGLLVPDLQKLQGFKEAANQLAGTTEWTIDNANKQLRYWYSTDVGEADDQDWSFDDGETYFATKELARRQYEEVNFVSCEIIGNDLLCTDVQLPDIRFDVFLTSRPKEIPIEPPIEKFVSFSTLLNKLFSNATAGNAPAKKYFEAVAMTAFDADTAKQLIRSRTFIGQFEEHKVLRDSDLPPLAVTVNRIYEFIVRREDNPNYRGDDAVTSVLVTQQSINNMFIQVRAEATANNNTALLQVLESALVCAYRRDKTWTTTNQLYSQHFLEVPFLDVVNQIFSNFMGSNAQQEASAKEYLSAVANSIYLPAAGDKLVKVSELTTHFEATKVLKSLVE